MKDIRENTIYSFDEFVEQCKYFYCNSEVECNVNNGYNCKHPNQEEVYSGVGCCFRWSCPLCVEADEEDFENDSIDKNGFTEFFEGEFVRVILEDKNI